MKRVQTGIIDSRKRSTSPTGSGGTTTPFTLTTIPIGNIDLIAPGRAASSFQGVFGVDGQQTNIPDANVQDYSQDDYMRFDWSLLQPNSVGVFNFTPFDNAVRQAIQRGQKFSFGIVPVDNFGPNGAISVGGGMIGYPLFLHTAMQGEATKDWLCNGTSPATWVPNWNSNTYLTAVENFLIGLANHINTTSFVFNSKTYQFRDCIYIVDIRMFGNFGEWHTFGICRGSEPAGTLATDVSLNRIIQAHMTAFPNYPLVGNVNMFNTEIPNNVAFFSLSASNAWGKLGWRNDHLGDTITYTYDLGQMNKTVSGLNIFNAAMDRWKTSPITGEPMNDATRVTSGGPSGYWQFETQVRNYHVVQFSNHNNVVNNTAANTNIRNASKATGYRIQITSGSISPTVNSGGIFKLTMNWENVGVSPTYEKWDTIIGFKNSGGTKVWEATSSFQPFRFLTGSRSVTDTFTLPTLTAGTYTAYVAVRESVGVRAPLPLANTGRQTDGSYIIRTVVVS